MNNYLDFYYSLIQNSPILALIVLVISLVATSILTLKYKHWITYSVLSVAIFVAMGTIFMSFFISEV